MEESDFLPYGTERVITDTLDNTYKFTGHERDAESGLDHTEYRKYASTTGRWLSPDSVRGNPSNPQTWNRYSYVAGNPTNFTDPHGAFLCGPDYLFCFFDWYWSYSFFDEGDDGRGCWLGTGRVYDRSPWPWLPCNIVIDIYLGYRPPPVIIDVPQPNSLPWDEGGNTLGLDPDLLNEFRAVIENPKWWQPLPVSSCTVYPEGGPLRFFCVLFGESQPAQSVRGCLQGYYTPGEGYKPILFDDPSWGKLHELDKEFGIGAHAVCIPEGIILDEAPTNPDASPKP